MVHKFEIDPNDGTVLNEIGNPWLPSGIGSPHGLGTDYNGFLYISSNTNGNTYQLTCDGEIVDTDFLSATSSSGYFNSFSIGNTLYTTDADQGTIVAYDLCDGTEIGALCLNDGGDVWGLELGADGCIYASRRWELETHAIYKICDWTEQDFIDGTCYDAFINNDTITTNATYDSYVVGVTTDESGNVYFITVDEVSGATCIQKYDDTGNFITEYCDLDGTDGGIYSGGGIVYNNGLLYVAGQDQCVAIVDAITMAPLAGGVEQSGDSKAIAVTTECCPLFETDVINETFCDATVGNTELLVDFLPCEFICAGEWSVQLNEAGVFDPCNNTFTYQQAGTSCFSYDYVPAPNNQNAICSEFHIDICLTYLESPNSPVISVTEKTCIPEISGGFNPGSFDIVTDCGPGSHIEWSTNGGATWSLTAPTYNNNAPMNVWAICVNDASSTCRSPITGPITTDPIYCPIYDVALSKSASPTTVSVGDAVVFTIVVENLEDDITGIIVNENLPSGLNYNGVHNASTGIFDGTTWTIGNMAAGQVASLQITAIVDSSGAGIINNTAFVNTSETESQLPNNVDNACISVPIEICRDAVIDIDLAAETGYTNYQWYQDGVLIPGATSSIYNATDVGTYTYTVNGSNPNGDCTGIFCCPFIIEEVFCCPPFLCVPVNATIVEP